MASINFILQSIKNPANIYLRFMDGRKKDFRAKTNLVVNPKEWNTAKQRPKNINNIENANLIKSLDKLKNDLSTKYNNKPLDETISTKWLKDFINPPIVKDRFSKGVLPTELIKYFDIYIEDKKSTIRPNSIKKIISSRNLLEKFQLEKGFTLMIKEVNSQFKTDFINFCISKHYAPSTTQKDIKIIKAVCTHSERNGLTINKQLRDFIYNPVKSKLKPIYLTFKELEKIELFEYSETLSNVKDWLIISCYTGQRVSDFMRFTSKMVKEVNGKAYIEFTQEKTNKNIAVALHSKVLDILSKRKGEFPKRIKNQKYNNYLKDVCKLAGINTITKGKLLEETKPNSKTFRKKEGEFEKWRLVSSHIGRRSFATNYYGTIPTSILIGTTGHSSEKQFLEYIGKSEVDTAMQLHNYF